MKRLALLSAVVVLAALVVAFDRFLDLLDELPTEDRP